MPTYRIFSPDDRSLSRDDRGCMKVKRYFNNFCDWIVRDIVVSKLPGWTREDDDSPTDKVVGFSNYVEYSVIKYKIPNYNDLNSKMRLYEFTRKASFSLPFIVFPSSATEEDVVDIVKEQIPKDGSLWFVKLDIYYSYGGYDVHPIYATNNMSTQVVKAIEASKSYKSFNEKVEHHFILQKGVDPPLLYDGKKFDIRVYYLITTVNNMMSCFVCTESLMRLSKKNYVDGSANKDVQITSTTFTDQGVILLNKDHPYYNKLHPGIYKLTRELSFIGRRRFVSKNDTPMFYLFGLDIIFDEDLNPYLEESNVRPLIFKTEEEAWREHHGIEFKLSEGIARHVIENLWNGRIPTSDFGYYQRVY